MLFRLLCVAGILFATHFTVAQGQSIPPALDISAGFTGTFGEGDGFFSPDDAAAPSLYLASGGEPSTFNLLNSYFAGTITLAQLNAYFRLDTDGDAFITTADAIPVQTVLNTKPFRNPSHRSDVNGDGNVHPIDILIALNEMNSRINSMTGQLETRFLLTDAYSPNYFDSSGDNYFTPLDVLIVLQDAQ